MAILFYWNNLTWFKLKLGLCEKIYAPIWSTKWPRAVFQPSKWGDLVETSIWDQSLHLWILDHSVLILVHVAIYWDIFGDFWYTGCNVKGRDKTSQEHLGRSGALLSGVSLVPQMFLTDNQTDYKCVVNCCWVDYPKSIYPIYWWCCVQRTQSWGWG